MRAARVEETGRRLGILLKGAAYSEWWLDAITITREDRCSDRQEDESTGSSEDNTNPSFDRTILQQIRQKGW